MEESYHFERLDAWQSARRLVAAVYKLTKKFPSEERFALSDQVRRAVISVPSNIAEGIGRMAVKETLHHLEIAYGSLMEVYCQLQVAVDLDYITDDEFRELKPQIFTTSKLISGLHRAKEKQV